MKHCRWKTWLSTAALAGALAFGGAPASAATVDDLGLLELDGNPFSNDDGAATNAADWEDFWDACGRTPGPCDVPAPTEDAATFTGIVDEYDDTANGGGVDDDIAFQGGTKDINLFAEWKIKGGSNQPKDEMTNVFAAAMLADNGDLILFGGADRLSNNGNSFLAVWFTQQDVSFNGTVNGEHEDGDLLVFCNFPGNVNNAPALDCSVYEWRLGAGNDGNDNLFLLFELAGGAVTCGNTAQTDERFCVITNNTNENPVPWPYTAANSTGVGPQTYPIAGFQEFGINISEVARQAGTEVPCVSSAIFETRSSGESVDSKLADLEDTSFEVCDVNAAKLCQPDDLTGTFCSDGTACTVDGDCTGKPLDEMCKTRPNPRQDVKDFVTTITKFDVEISNGSIGTLHDPAIKENVTFDDLTGLTLPTTPVPGSEQCEITKITDTDDSVTDLSGAPVDISDGTYFDLEPLVGGDIMIGANETVVVEVTCDTLDNPFENSVTVRTASSNGGSPTITETAAVDLDSPGADPCSVAPPPDIDVRKECTDVRLMTVGDDLVVTVLTHVEVENTGQTVLVNLLVEDTDVDGTVQLNTGTGEDVLLPGETLMFDLVRTPRKPMQSPIGQCSESGELCTMDAQCNASATDLCEDIPGKFDPNTATFNDTTVGSARAFDSAGGAGQEVMDTASPSGGCPLCE